LFRSEVARGAHDRPRQRHAGRVLDRAGDPEVGHLELAALVEEQIRRLYVAMDDSALVGGVDRLTGLREPVERLRGRHCAASGLVGERPTGEVFHDDERPASEFADVIDGDDVRLARKPRCG